MDRMQTTDPTSEGDDTAEHLSSGLRWQRGFGATLYLAVLATAYVWPTTAAGGITVCPFRRAFDLSCFGCGMTRGWTSMLHGEWLAALTYHPFAPVLLVGLGLWALHAAAEAVSGRVLDPRAIPGWSRVQKPVLLGALVFVVIFGLLRVALELMGVIAPI
ncbi:MAG: DUF2752 domain-containing protein [Myxococcota bacterium]